MTSRWMFGGIVAGVTGLTLLVTPLRVAADECQQACGAVASSAVSAGKAALKSCKLQCRRNADPRACGQGCRASLKQARGVVKASLAQCSQVCRPANSCEDLCLVPARQCLAPILGQAKSCTRSCAAAAAEAAAACSSAADPLACREEVAHQLHMCVQGCATTAGDSAEACKSALEACKQGCAPANPCEGQCVPALRSCLEPVVQQAHQCGEQCVLTVHDASAACLSDPDPAACLARVAQQLAQCALSCKSTAAQQAQDCRAAFAGCVHDCLPPDPCRDACDGTLRECVAPIAGDGRACGEQCAADALAAATACPSAENPVACLLEAERILGECAHGCASHARARAAGCWEGFRQCAERCGPLGDGTCRGACLGSAAQCVGPVVDHAKGCAQACASIGAPQVLACLTQADPSACLNALGQQILQCAQGCKTDAETGVQACRAGLGTCVQACPADQCRDGCVGSLESCIEPVARQAEACAIDCATAAVGAGAACVSQADPLLCLGQVAEQAAQCGRGCEATARADGAACWMTYQDCQQGCGP